MKRGVLITLVLLMSFASAYVLQSVHTRQSKDEWSETTQTIAEAKVRAFTQDSTCRMTIDWVKARNPGDPLGLGGIFVRMSTRAFGCEFDCAINIKIKYSDSTDAVFARPLSYDRTDIDYYYYKGMWNLDHDVLRNAVKAIAYVQTDDYSTPYITFGKSDLQELHKVMVYSF